MKQYLCYDDSPVWAGFKDGRMVARRVPYSDIRKQERRKKAIEPLTIWGWWSKMDCTLVRK